MLVDAMCSRRSIQPALRALGLACVVASAGCPRSPGVPVDDVCTDPASSGFDSIELGQPTLSSTFEALGDDAVVPVIVGSQGSNMIELRYRVRGGNSRCIAQRAAISIPGGPELVSQESALNIYTQDDGSYLTRSYFVILDRSTAPPPASYVDLTVTVGMLGDDARVWLGAPYDGPDLLEPTPESSTLSVGSTTTVTLALAGPPAGYVQGYAAVDGDALEVYGAFGFNAGETSSTLTVDGVAVGSGTLYVGLGDQTFEVPLEVVTP